MKKIFKKLTSPLVALTLFFPMIALAKFFDSETATILVPLGLPMASSTAIMENTITWILTVVGFLAIIGFCIAGILYLTSAGDEDRQKSAKRAMFYAITGVIVSLMGYVIWKAAIALLKGNSGF